MNADYSRRDFLTGRASSPLPPAVAPNEANDPPDRPTAAPYLINYTRPAMACQFTVYVPADETADHSEPVLRALDLIEALEAQLTVYRDDSELSRLNARAADTAVPVEPQLCDLLQLAARLARQSNQAFDITAGPLSTLWMDHGRHGRVPDRKAIRETLQVVGSQHLVFGAQNTLHFARPGVQLNLGGIGKGYALDRCRQLLLAAGVEHFLMHGGQSSVLAAGARRGQGDQGWQIELRHPFRDQHRLATLTLQNRALGTSGSARQSFTIAGQRYGHIIDPRSGWPATGVLSATVVADSAAVADALATAMYVSGIESAQSLLDHDPTLGGLIVTPGKVAGTVVLHALNLADGDWRCHDATAEIFCHR